MKLCRLIQSLIIIRYCDTCMNHLAQLFNKSALNPLPIKIETRQEFFTTKKTQKRLKASLCLPDTIETFQPPEPKLDCSLNTSITGDTLNLDNKELDSTFAEESHIHFKAKPPKRKINVRCPVKEYQSASLENEYPLIDTLNLCENGLERLALQKELRSTEIRQEKKIKITDFSLLSKIGEGSSGEVFMAIHKHTGFLCALKLLEKIRIEQELLQENVIRELKINSFLQHPNIAKLYGFFQETKYIVLICEYSTDSNLYSALYQPKLKLKKGLKNDEAAAITKQICLAVDYLHLNCIMHRDIKPENILLTMGNTVKVCDFGWSVYNPDSTLRRTLCGTPLYLAPELIAHKQYDESVDIWAVGVITYQLLTEEMPFDISSPDDLFRIISDEIRISRVRNKVAADFIEKALQKDRSKRISIRQLTHHPFVQ